MTGLLALAVPLAVTAMMFATPAGLLPLLVTRRQRWRWRRWLATRRLWARPRGRQRSAKISRWLRVMVERADRHRCVACGARWRRGMERFPVDHIVPWIMGGLTCLANCALLCKRCNTVKSCYWVAPSGRVYYRGRNAPQAAEILAAEQAALRSPARWLRAFGLLPGW